MSEIPKAPMKGKTVFVLFSIDLKGRWTVNAVCSSQALAVNFGKALRSTFDHSGKRVSIEEIEMDHLFGATMGLYDNVMTLPKLTEKQYEGYRKLQNSELDPKGEDKEVE